MLTMHEKIALEADLCLRKHAAVLVADGRIGHSLDAIFTRIWKCSHENDSEPNIDPRESWKWNL
jgi:hypothetical protein